MAATPVRAVPAPVGQAAKGEGGLGVVPLGNAARPPLEPVPSKRPAQYFWAVVIARIQEVFPLLCPNCGGRMRLIAFITHNADIRHILEHIGVAPEPPHIATASGPPLWDECDVQMDDRVQVDPGRATHWCGQPDQHPTTR